MPLLARLALAFAPKGKDGIGCLLILLAIPFLIFVFIIQIPTILFKTTPMVETEHVEIYQQVVQDIGEKTGVRIDFKMLIAVDAVLLDQDFSKATARNVNNLAKRFIKEESVSNDDGTEQIDYALRDFDTVLNELMEEGLITDDQIEDIKDYYKADLNLWLGNGSDQQGEDQSKPPEIRPVPGGIDFAWPAPDSSNITSEFGTRTDPINGKIDSHTGMDICSGRCFGQDVVAIDDGEVFNVEKNANAACGYNIRIKHSNGFQSRYCHLSSILTQKGAKVSKGQVIAKIGKTGRVTGPHLHLEMKKDGKLVNPKRYIGAARP
ncbi:M23 family metallopeptidase [Brevibacillus laterosporus]|uniref:M23 family metallopeptidase n=1 Tax=Brevibacillus halotolerans TaxID=1507437 RepID=A0ABT4I3X0_9BACL|nr:MULTISPECIES: M23 family metallopeptidase [Brevibacillus]MCR8987667.1 M23 family metallopeptidase [Brevibacillus laterosporus]MCZ0833406.1 M23 family metallopeptidase [Brevibacillus halotolerans]